MASFGAYLRELREARGVSLDEISEVTRIARAYLEALEREDLAKLPAPVFIRGFIRAYCDTLHVAPNEALARYEGSAAGSAERTVGTPGPRRGARHGRGQVLVSLVLLVVLGAALLAVTTTLRGERESPPPDRSSAPAATPNTAPTTAGGSPEPSGMASTAAERAGGTTRASGESHSGTGAPAAPAHPEGPARVADAPGGRPDSAGRVDAPGGRADAPGTGTGASAGTAVERAAPGPRADLPVDRERAAPPVAGPVVAAGATRGSERDAAVVAPPYRLIARTSEPTWIRVRTEDGQHLSEEVIPAGQVREWVSNRRFALRVGNAGGVRLELNGRDLPPLGRPGEVVERLLVPSGTEP